MDERDVVKALPKSGFLRDYVYYAITRTDAHALYHVAGGLSILTQTVPSDLMIPYGSRLFPNLFFLIVADSSDRKSAAIDLAGNLLREAIPDAVQEEPGSPAGLIDGIARRPHQLILYPEFGHILAQSVTGQLHPIRTLYSQAFDCGALGRNTLTGQREKRTSLVPDPRVSMLAGCSPEFLESYTDPTAWGGGFMGRFCFIAEARIRDERLVDKQVTIESRAAHHNLAKMIRGYVDARAPTAIFGDGEVISQCGGLTAKAQQLHIEWCRKRPSEILRSPVPRPVKSAVGRAETICLKIAFLISWDLNPAARSGAPWFIDEEAMRFAIWLSDVHLNSALHIIETIALDRDAQNRRKIVGLTGAAPRKRADVLAESQLSVRHFNEAVATLIESKRIKTFSEEGSGEIYIVHHQSGASDDPLPPPPSPLDPVFEATSNIFDS